MRLLLLPFMLLLSSCQPEKNNRIESSAYSTPGESTEILGLWKITGPSCEVMTPNYCGTSEVQLVVTEDTLTFQHITLDDGQIVPDSVHTRQIKFLGPALFYDHHLKENVTFDLSAKELTLCLSPCLVFER